MIRKILIGFLAVVVLLIAAFIFEEIRFNNYISANKKDGSNNMNLQINKDAPVISKAEILIDSEPEKVWRILTSINNWPDWQSEVSEAKLSGQPEEGTEFTWKAGGLSFSSKIHTSIPNKAFGWTGKTIGVSAIHNWFIEEKDGKTLLKVEESLQGILPFLFRSYFQSILDKGVLRNVEELKSASEK